MVYLIDFQQYGLNHIMSDNLKVGFAQQVLNILFAASEEVVQADDLHHLQTKRFADQGTLQAPKRLWTGQLIRDLPFQPNMCTNGFRQSLHPRSPGLGSFRCGVWS